MPRPISSTTALAVVSPVTSPLFLVHLVTQTDHKWSSLDEALIGGFTWADANMEVEGPTQQSGGALEAVITVPDSLEGIGAECLALRPHDSRCDLYKTYWDGKNYTDPTLLIDGVVTGVEFIDGEQVREIAFTIRTKGNRGGVSPFVRIDASLISHITPDGSQFTWGATTIITA